MNILQSNKLTILLIVFLTPFCFYSQENDLGNWLIYIGNKKLDKGFDIHSEIQYRNYNSIGDLEQLLLRTGIGYNLTENNNNVLLGYGYILSKNYINDSDEKNTVEEHRIFQQFTTKQNFGRIGISHRYRIEERFVEDEFKMRFRYFLGLKIPLHKVEDGMNLFYLSTYNEIFLNSETIIFDRNRVYGGIGYQISNDLRFELGYMNQIFNKSNRDQINLIAFINF